MIELLAHIISKKNLILEQRYPFLVTVTDSEEGFSLAKDMLYEISDKKTALYLSGGKTPKEFYTALAKEEKLVVGAVGLIDERFGEPMHEKSNEQMIQQSGLIGYLHYKHIPFYSVLQPPPLFTDTGKQDDTIQAKAQAYDQTVRFLCNGFSKSIGILGIGTDGHIAGIPAGEKEIKNGQQSVVTYFTNFPGPQKQRITMTFLGLSMLDLNLVLVFGEDKKQALEKMFHEGSEEEIPARFFKRPDIAQKTLLITDQKV